MADNTSNANMGWGDREEAPNEAEKAKRVAQATALTDGTAAGGCA